MDRNFHNGFDNRAGVSGIGSSFGSENVLPLHPRGTPDLTAEAGDSTGAIEEFVFRVAASMTKDYGDWMRDANFYLWELHKRLRNEESIQEHLARLHGLIQYTPNWQPIETCREVIRIATQMRDLVSNSLAEKAGPAEETHNLGISLTESDVPEAN